MKNLVLFMGYYFDLPEDAFRFATLNEYHLYKSAIDYETLKSGLGEYVKKVMRRRDRQMRTLTGEYLRSSQEVQIANFLYLNGIDYEYEKPYPAMIHGARKKYTPDFFISQGENQAYIEHYGLSEGMKSTFLTDQQLAKYQKSISDKRLLHKRNRTKLLETWSFYRDKRPLIDHLKEVLIADGFTLRERDLTEVYKQIVETAKDKYIYKLVWFMLHFIEQFKTSGYDSAGFDVLRNKTDNVRNLLFIDIAEEVYRHYQETLRKRNQVDFADMINEANKLLNEMEKQGVKPTYKYIVIDEFQDIARQRFNLTKRLSDITRAKVIAVGDDWQSVYAFAGSDITLFTKFIELMGSGIEMKITHTYRNSQELIDIAGGFIQKNLSKTADYDPLKIILTANIDPP
jgi:DNA helicase-4